MHDLCTTSFFAGNRRRLRQAIQADNVDGPIVVTAAGLLQRGGDSTYAFQQDANFWYLTGIDEPDIILVMDEDSDYLIVPPREGVREAFDGAVDFADLSARSGIRQALGQAEGWDKLTSRLGRAKLFAAPEPLPAYVERFGFYANPARAALVAKIRTAAPEIELVDIRRDLAQLRMVKQKPELNALQAAIDITIDSLLDAAAPDELAHCQNEHELDAAIAYGFRKRGARGNAFEPIIAGGANAATIHNMANNAPLRAGELVVVDVGAEYQHYCADITRTYSVGGKPSRRQQALYDAVLDVQHDALGLLKPGTLLGDFEKQIEACMGKKLLDLKLIKTADRESIRRYYPHACSHFLGLDPHDAGDYNQPLAAGMVLTCEPGIYIPEEGIGVRLEDDIVITTSGNAVLSARLPKRLC